MVVIKEPGLYPKQLDSSAVKVKRENDRDHFIFIKQKIW